ncbi:MAG: S41 family peptidase [Thermoanaerobaculia bacterium]
MRVRIRYSAFVLLWVVLSLVATPARAAAGDEPARRLSPEGIENLQAFAKLLGYVRFFHPSDQAAAANWDQVTIAGVQRMEDASSPADLARSLQDFFQPLAPTLRVYLDGNAPAVPAELFPPAGVANPEVLYWRHNGVKLPSTLPFTYTSFRLTAVGAAPAGTGLPPTAAPIEVSLGRGVRALLPLTVYKDALGSIPHTSAPAPAPDKPAGWTASGNDRTTRLADVALAWTVLQHFYPYFNVVQADWPAELPAALRTAAEDVDARAFVETLRRLMAAIDDGHARVTHSSWDLNYQLPLVWVWLDNQLVITWADPAGAPGLGAGDVVLTLNGQPAQQAYRDELALAPGATPQHLRYRALQMLLLGPWNEAVQLRVLKAHGGVEEVTVRRTSFVGGPGGEMLSEPRPENLAEIRPGIIYVDINRLTDDDFINALDRLSAARGIIFDFRGYPWDMEWYTPLFFLNTESMGPARFDRPLVFRPDRQGWGYTRSTFLDGPYDPFLTAKIAFITDGRAISFAESYMGIVEGYHLGEIVGEATAGTNGTINFIGLPGGYSLRFTGMRVTKHDGSQHHGVGIQPTVPVTQTYAGVAAGRDEFLEKAIEVVSRP